MWPYDYMPSKYYVNIFVLIFCAKLWSSVGRNDPQRLCVLTESLLQFTCYFFPHQAPTFPYQVAEELF